MLWARRVRSGALVGDVRIVDNPAMNSRRQWDIFCKVIDNFGDIGVSWRLSADLAARGQTVRLWVDDASALRWMAPLGAPGVTVLPWRQAEDADALAALLQANPGEVLVEAFGCDIPPQFLSAWLAAPLPGQTSPVSGRCWLNLEYLSAEAYVARSHALPSPVQHGPAAGCSKWFFYPGFTPQTGGLMREPDLIERMTAFEANEAGSWLQSLGLQVGAPGSVSPLRVSMLCYEPPALGALLRQWSARGLAGRPVELLVTPGRSAEAVKAAMAEANCPLDSPGLRTTCLPWLSQQDYDKLLWACDMNFVRGEDSVLRALWTGKPFVWQIYPQQDDVHLLKLTAFLEQNQLTGAAQNFHAAWNDSSQKLPEVDAGALADWQDQTRAARARLLAQDALSDSLLKFVAKNR
jgi:uncharacterized repeat protein (TIGR03837 family)